MKCLFFLFALSIAIVVSAQEKGATPLSPPHGATARVAPTTRAVVVGISDYQDSAIPDLRFADRDAEAFAAYLQSPAGGALPGSQIILLQNEKATNARIADALIWMLETSKPGDQAIIYFSGHGDVETITKFNRGYLLTYDSPSKIYMAGAFNVRDLQDIISTMSANQVQVVMISDACHAGKLAGEAVGGTAATAQNLSQQFANEVKILSCQPNEFSLEGEQWGGGRGAFSYNLLDGLCGLADKNGDAEVNLFEIGRYLEDRVPEETAPNRQMPFTVGDRNALLARVDAPSLAALRSKKEQEQPQFAKIDSKGMEQLLLAKADTSVPEMYAAFNAAIANKQLLPDPSGEPAGTSAYDLYQVLSKKPEIEELHNFMRRDLSVALQEDAQQAVNAYLAANPEELQRRYNNEKDYSLYPRYLDKACELLGPQHFYYKNLMAKHYYFEGLGQRMAAAKEEDQARVSMYQEAIKTQLKALEYEPRAVFVYNELGLLYTELNVGSEAIGYLKKAIEITPAWGLPYINLSSALARLKRYDEALEYAQKAIELMPDNPSAYNFLAWFATQGTWRSEAGLPAYLGTDLQQNPLIGWDNTVTIEQRKKIMLPAISLLEKAVAMKPDFFEGYFNLSSMYGQIGEPLKRRDYLLKALDLKPDNMEVLMSLGDVYQYALVDIVKAEQYYLKCIELYPAVGWLNNNLGDLYYRSGRTGEAEVAWKKTITMVPGNIWARAGLGYLCLMSGRIEEGEKWYLEALSLKEDSPPLRVYVARFYLQINRLDDAEYMFQKALELKPDYADAIDGISNVCIRNNQFEKALEWQKKRLELVPDDAFSYFNPGKLLYQNKQPGEAKKYFDKAAELSTHPSTPNEIAWFCIIHGEYEWAETYLHKAFSIDSTNYSHYSNLALVHVLNHRMEEAQALLDKGIALQTVPRWKGFLTNRKGFYYYLAGQMDKMLQYAKSAESIEPAYAGLGLLSQKIVEKDYPALNFILAELIKKFPTEPLAHYLNIGVQLHLQKPEAALQSLGKALEHGLAWQQATVSLELEPLRQMPGYEKIMHRYFPEKYGGLEAFDWQEEAPPSYFPANCLTLAKYYESRNEPERAKFLYEKAMEQKTGTLTNQQALTLAGVYLRLGRMAEAKAVCPDSIEAETGKELFEAGKLFYMLGKNKAATVHFEKYMAVEKNPNPLDRVDVFYKNHGAFKLAEPLMKAAIEASPAEMYYRRNLARLYFFTGKKQEAFAVLEEAKKISPGDFTTNALKAVLRYFDQPKTAKIWFDEVAQFRPEFNLAWDFLESIRKNEFEKADKDWTVFSEKFDAFWGEMIKYKYLQMKIRQGEKEKTIQLFSEILRRNYFVNYQLFATDPGLDPIRDTEGFKSLMRRYFPEKAMH